MWGRDWVSHSMAQVGSASWGMCPGFFSGPGTVPHQPDSCSVFRVFSVPTSSGRARGQGWEANPQEMTEPAHVAVRQAVPVPTPFPAPRMVWPVRQLCSPGASLADVDFGLCCTHPSSSP